MLDGKSIYLKPIREEDSENIVYWRNKEFVRECCVHREEFTREKHEKWMETMVRTGKVEQFIIYTESGKAIGSVYLKDIDRENSKAEYGIFIGEEEYLGQGIGCEAAKLILRYAFDELKMHKVFLKVFASNIRAAKSYQKAGFVEEGYFKDDVNIEGRYYDMIYMATINV